MCFFLNAGEMGVLDLLHMLRQRLKADKLKLRSKIFSTLDFTYTGAPLGLGSTLVRVLERHIEQHSFYLYQNISTLAYLTKQFSHLQMLSHGILIHS